jgi:hypothetical protein
LNQEILFIVCVEAEDSSASLDELRDRLASWKAEPCLPRIWLLTAPVTARESLAPALCDENRLPVAEINDAIWYNLAHRPGQSGGRRSLHSTP